MFNDLSSADELGLYQRTQNIKCSLDYIHSTLTMILGANLRPFLESQDLDYFV